MQINDNYWGGLGTTENVYYGMDRSTKSLYEGFNDDSIPLNEELDVSISPWAINPNADIVGLQYPLMYRDNDTNNIITDFQDIIDYEREGNTGIPFYFAGDNILLAGNYANNFYWYSRNAYNQALLNDDTYIKMRAGIPIIKKFDYNRLCAVPVIELGYHSNYSWREERQLGSFINDVTYYTTGDYFVSGISFKWYYATLENYPNSRVEIPLHMNFLGAPIDITKYIPNANLGYSNPYLDNFIIIDKIGDRGDAYYNSVRISDGTTWAQNIEQCYNFNFAIDSYNLTIPHTGSNRARENGVCWWDTVGIWTGTATPYYKSRLNVDGKTNDEIIDYIRKQCAYLGVWICDNSYNVNSVPGSDSHWMLGEIDENGITTGNYAVGTDTANIENSTWSNPWDDSGYNGRNDDPTPWDDSQSSTIISTNGDPSYGTSEYLMSENALNQLIRVLNELKIGEVGGDVKQGYCENAFGDTDPMSAIISVVKYPFEIIGNWCGNYSEQIIAGSNVGNWFSIANAQLAVSVGSAIPSPGTIYTIDLLSAHEIYKIDWENTKNLYGTVQLPYYPKYNCFLDYEPYSAAELYVPFCGAIKIDPEIFVGHNVGVDYAISIIDGTAKSFIKRDNLIIDTLTGNIGNKIEISSADEVAKSNAIQQLNAVIQAQKMNTVKRFANISSNVAGGAAFGGQLGAFAGATAGIVNTVFDTLYDEHIMHKNEFEITTTETPFKQLQPGGGFLSAVDEYAIRLVVYRPELLPGYDLSNLSDYGKTRGFATYDISSLSTYTGYVECDNIIIDSISATEKEKEMIFELMKGGVIL